MLKPSVFKCFIFFCVITNAVFAQKLTVENVKKITLRQSNPIKEGSDVKGYYFFYQTDKVSRKVSEFTLDIYDNNLVKLKSVVFEDDNDTKILESSFNGVDLIFMFLKDDQNLLELRVYGADGKQKQVYNKTITKKDKAYIRMMYNLADDESQFSGLYPIEGKGFIANTPSREDRDYTFNLDYYSTETKKQWTYTPTMEGKRFVADYLGTYNNVVFVELLVYSSNTDGNPESSLLGISLENGKQLFNKKTATAKTTFYPTSLSVLNDGKAYLYGEYFLPSANINKDHSVGFAFWNIDDKGNVLSEKYNSWSKDMGKYMNVSAEGKIDDFGYMFLHNITQTADGSIYAVGEGYKKVASALGILNNVAAIAGGGFDSRVSVSKMKITDLAVIKFDPTFKVISAKIYPKNSNAFEMPAGSLYASSALLGKAIKYNYGGFDYEYTQTTKDFSSVSFFYSDYERSKGYKGATFNSITTIAGGKTTTDKIELKSDATSLKVLPAKTGQVLIIEYFRKKKTIDLHFEKIN